MGHVLEGGGVWAGPPQSRCWDGRQPGLRQNGSVLCAVPFPREDHPERRRGPAPPRRGQGPGAEAAAAEASGAPRWVWGMRGRPGVRTPSPSSLLTSPWHLRRSAAISRTRLLLGGVGSPTAGNCLVIGGLLGFWVFKSVFKRVREQGEEGKWLSPGAAWRLPVPVCLLTCCLANVRRRGCGCVWCAAYVDRVWYASRRPGSCPWPQAVPRLGL